MEIASRVHTLTGLEFWNQSVELTACRAGLLLSGDLEIARKIIGSEPQLSGALTPAEKIRELVLFSVSDDYTSAKPWVWRSVRSNRIRGAYSSTARLCGVRSGR